VFSVYKDGACEYMSGTNDSYHVFQFHFDHATFDAYVGTVFRFDHYTPIINRQYYHWYSIVQ
jgi:hypothetical protein